MHTRWKKFSSDERAIFLHDQKVFAEEEFDADKTTFEKVPLSFYPGYSL